MLYDDDQYDVLDNTIDEKPVAEQAEQVSGGCGGAGGEPPKKRFQLLNRSYVSESDAASLVQMDMEDEEEVPQPPPPCQI